MRTNILKSFLSIAVLSAFFTSCVNDDDYGIPNLDCVDPGITANVKIDSLYGVASELVKQYPFNVNKSEYIEAYVVSSDQGGNFFKSISLQTLATPERPSYGFSVSIDANSLFITYEPGRKVYVKVNRQYYSITHGSLVIGDIYIDSEDGTASVGRISALNYGDVMIRSCEVVNEDDLVTSFSGLSGLLDDSNLNKLVELNNVQIDASDLGSTYYDANNDLGGATNHSLTDRIGNSVIFRTSSYANYAGKIVQSGSGKVRGVLTKYNDDYQFIARTEDDIQLNQPRLTSFPVFFSENFESVATGSTANISINGWTNVSVNGGTVRWTGREFSGNKYAQFSAYNINDNNVDVRLITPSISLNNVTDKYLRFGTKVSFFNGVALTVWYSTNYDGSGTVAAINAATWTELPTIIPSIQDNSYAANFYNIVANLSEISSNNIHIAFRYQGASNGVTTTYQIDNVEFLGE